MHHGQCKCTNLFTYMLKDYQVNEDFLDYPTSVLICVYLLGNTRGSSVEKKHSNFHSIFKCYWHFLRWLNGLCKGVGSLSLFSKNVECSLKSVG